MGRVNLGRKLEAFAIALSVFDDRVYEALRIYYWEAESARSESQVPYVAYHFAVPFFFEQGVEFDESNKKHWEKREWWNGGTREFHGNCQNRVASSWRLCRELLHRDGSNLSDFSAASLSFKLDLKVNSENENQMRGWNMNTYGIINLMKPLILDVFRCVFPLTSHSAAIELCWLTTLMCSRLCKCEDTVAPHFASHLAVARKNSIAHCCCTCAVNMTNWIVLVDVESLLHRHLAQL